MLALGLIAVDVDADVGEERELEEDEELLEGLGDR